MTIESCSWTVAPSASTEITLKCIWAVRADITYDVARTKKHSEYLVAIRTTAGQGRLMFDKMPPVAAGANTLIIFQNRHLIRYYCNDRRWNFWWFEFDAHDLLGLAVNKLIDMPAIAGEYGQFKACFQWLKGNNAATRALASSMFGTIVHRWAAHWQHARSPQKPHQQGIDQVICKMRESLASPVPIETLAGYLHLSSRRFRQVFRDVTGKTPKKYYDFLRLSMAAQWLRQGGCSATKVAYRLGFSSPYHFSRAFKACFGRPPSHFYRSTK